MKNQTVLITGANAGIGFEITKGVLLKNNTAIMVCRNREKAMDARKKLIDLTKNNKVHIIIADLTQFSDLRHIADEVNEKFDTIDVLIHNAGSFYSKWLLNDANIELTFMVNHVTPFYLSHLLLPQLIKSEDAKIITINSDSHFLAKLRIDNLNLKNKFQGLRAYGHSKLANVMFTYHFEKINPYDNLTIYAVHPGLVNTDIGIKNTNWLFSLIWNWRSKQGKTPEQGAETALFITHTPGTNLESGRYWDHNQPKKSSTASYDEAMAERLWKKSKDLCGIVNYF